MKNLYQTTANLDKRAISKYLLSEEILMENAASALESLIRRVAHAQSVVYIVCGSGDNGGDGYALARKLHKDYRVKIYEAKEPKSALCQLQSERAQTCGCERVSKILPCDVVVDCLFGSGFGGEMGAEFARLIESMNANARIRIACDIPSGLRVDGSAAERVFDAHYTLSMGALKLALFSDSAKDCVGEVIVGDLGVSRALYEVQSPYILLEKSDLKLPHRTKLNCHKGNFGHVAVVSGDKQGASVLSALASLRIGAGLVSLVSASAIGTGSVDSSAGSAESKKVDFADSMDSMDSADSADSAEILESLDAGAKSRTSAESSASQSLEASENLFGAESKGAGFSALNSGVLDSGVLDSNAGAFGTRANALESALLDSAFSPFPEIMRQSSLPQNTSVLVVGMGLGAHDLGLKEILDSSSCAQDRQDDATANTRASAPKRIKGCVIDADMFYKREILEVLEMKDLSLVLTPHPKEFAAFCRLCGLGDVSLEDVVRERLALAQRFSEAYPHAVLLLKGANTIIAHQNTIYINPLGTPALAKGGSGDVLSGLIGGYLAQGFSALDSAICASLAHALAAQKERNTYALTPLRLIEHIGEL
ncbi:NAD(P)H-hydrate epimerase [Helicobacter sp. CLO-3]|uniref:NAD(P)H-hydrate epimerase n=1 Tax=unclassified Helicobacter TaxID=2593540 RepID=UPI0008058AD1|nr:MULTISPECIES: NAD(P)H-hydrate epimerase [unclassified Helicobacter]OBV28595.1 NAD(P)H-hydrate epimerase [Helicobacter sp. CLO-3]OHU81004.1 NAD(P)H-hydrate epimerase [Helicobacter sp. CLO-3]